jgi:opacity protein-like surface antigen
MSKSIGVTKISRFAAARRLGSAAAFAAVLCAPSVMAQQTNYAGVHLGMNTLSRWPLEVNFGRGVTTPGYLELDNGIHGGLMFGRQLNNGFRYELEYQQGRINIDSVTLGPVSRNNSAHGKYQVLMLNGYRDFVLGSNWNAYLAAGIGWGSVKMPSLPPLNGCNCFQSASGTDVALQLRAGAEYEVAAGRKVFLQYSALRLPGVGSDVIPSVDYARRTVGAITVGYRMNY